MKGLEVFKEKFANYQGNYVVIGGMACYIIFEELGLDFRATKDVDMVVLMEDNAHDFAANFWDFIYAGAYQSISRDVGKKNLYRFTKPLHKNYPAAIELFSRKPEGIVLANDAHTLPIHIDDGVRSLSAILMEDAFYELLINNKKVINGITVLQEEVLLVFKVKAYLDILERMDKGEAEEGVGYNLKKHKNDVIRLGRIINPTSKVLLPNKIKDDLRKFASLIEKEDINFKQLGWREQRASERFFALLKEVYDL